MDSNGANVGYAKMPNGNPWPADFLPGEPGLNNATAETFGAAAGVIGIARGLLAAGADALATASASGASREAGSTYCQSD